MIKTEKEIQNGIRVALSNAGAIVWRNNVGLTGEDPTGRRTRYGLCVGSSDLIGIYRGKFLAVEVKRPGGKATREQLYFLDIIRRNGGIAGIVHSAEEALKLIGAA
jgi:hypothetical protein